MKVSVIGDALIDEMRDPSGSVDAPGGSALNVAVGLALLGVDATLVATFGDDADGQTLTRYLASHDVALVSSPAPLGTGRAISDRTDGEPRYSFNQAQVERAIEFGSAAHAIAESDIVAVSGFPFDDAEQVDRLRAAVHGKTLLIDPNPRVGLLRDAQRFAHNLEQLAPVTDLIKIGEEDAQLLWHLPLAAVARRLLDGGARAVLATAGPDGATIYLPDTSVHCPVVRLATPIVDTMGAGDATFAAVIAQYKSTDDWGATLRDAMAIAAETIRHPGGLLRIPANQ